MIETVIDQIIINLSVGELSLQDAVAARKLNIELEIEL